MNKKYFFFLSAFIFFSITLVSCPFLMGRYHGHGYEDSTDSHSFDEFVEIYNDGVEPNEDYTFTYERIELSSIEHKVLFTVKVTRKENNSTFEIKNRKGKSISKEEFLKSFSSDELFESISSIYEFFIDYCTKFQEKGGEIWTFIGDDQIVSKDCYFEGYIYTSKKYNCPNEITIHRYNQEISVDDYFDKRFDIGYRIRIYDFELL